jgi:hypothetical protein
MDHGIPRVGLGLNAQRADRVSPKKDREREEQADFAEAMEHRGEKEAAASHDEPPKPHEIEAPSMGYPTEDEAGNSLDLKA